MIFDWQKSGPKNQEKLCGDVRDQMREAEPRPRRGEGGGKPPPGLGGSGESDWKGEKLGGSEEKKGDLHADPMGRRIL